jgi:transcriptional regulator with XRE-family HTH domain
MPSPPVNDIVDLPSFRHRRPAFDRDKYHEEEERKLGAAIGREVRNYRRQRGMTVADLASLTGLSISMLSKIENGKSSPSLTSLQILSHAFSISVPALFKNYEVERKAQHLRASMQVVRQQYMLLGHLVSNSSGVVMEPHIITMTIDSDAFPDFQRKGLGFLYMLEGALDYRHGKKVYSLKHGDSLLFDADTPHGPDVLVKLPARYLLVISCLDG